MHNLQVQPSHYRLWEDYRAGMYAPTFNKNRMSEAVRILEDPQMFRRILRDVAEDWPFATAQHLSDFCKNHQPWCGRMACSYEVGATIREVNEAWAFLSCMQRESANAVADSFTYAWRAENLRGQMSWTV